jgi:O-antigen/teichoic acid export membrane protein
MMEQMLATLQEKVHQMLRSTERYTKTDMVYLAENGGWLVLAQVLMGLIAFGLSIGFAHFVSKETYGTYRFLLSAYWTLTAFSLTGLPTALSRAVAQGFDGTYHKSFRLSFLWSLPLSGIALLMSGYYFWNENLLLALGSAVIAILGPFMQMSLLYGPFLEGKKDFKHMALYGIALNAFGGLLTLCSMFFTTNPVIFLGTYLLGNILAGLTFCAVTYYRYRPAEKSGTDLISLSSHFSIMNILATLSQQIDKLLVFHYLGAVQLAVYTFAIALPEQAKSFANSVATIAFPKFAKQPIEEIRKNFWGRLWLFTGSLVLAAFMYILIAPFLFHLFFPTYPEAVFYSQVFALSLIFISNTIPPTLLEARAAKKELYLFNIIAPLLQIGSLVVLTIMYGLIGTILARIVSRGLALVLGAYLVKSYTAKF